MSPLGSPVKRARLRERGDDEDEAGCRASEAHRANATRRRGGKCQVLAPGDPARRQQTDKDSGFSFIKPLMCLVFYCLLNVI